MNIKNFTKWDLDLIKSRAKDELLDRNISVEEAWVTAVLGAIHAMGYDVVKSEREPTWSKLTSAHYTPALKHKNWWKKDE